MRIVSLVRLRGADGSRWAKMLTIFIIKKAALRKLSRTARFRSRAAAFEGKTYD
jgi:hypothetical protein